MKGGNTGDGGDGSKSGGCEHVIGRWPLSIAFKLIKGRRNYCYLTERDFLGIAKIIPIKKNQSLTIANTFFHANIFSSPISKIQLSHKFRATR